MERRFLVCDGVSKEGSKVHFEAVARSVHAERAAAEVCEGDRVALTGLLRSEEIRLGGGSVLGYELVVSHMDPGFSGDGEQELGVNSYAISGRVVSDPVIVGVPGQEKCRFWVCDGDSEEESGVKVEVLVRPGKSGEATERLRRGDRVVVTGFLNSVRKDIPGAPFYELELVATYVDYAFADGGGMGPQG